MKILDINSNVERIHARDMRMPGSGKISDVFKPEDTGSSELRLIPKNPSESALFAESDYKGEKADNYTKEINFTGGPDQAITKRYLETIPSCLSGKVVVDVGCGDGKMTNEVLAQRDPDFLLGVDINSEFLATAAADIIPGFPVTFALSDMHSIRRKKNSTDLITSRFALHYSNNLTGLFRELGRILKPGGELIFLTNMARGKDSDEVPQEVKNDRWIPIRLSENVKVNNLAHSKADYLKAMKQAGLQVESLEYVNATSKIDKSYPFLDKVELDAVVVRVRKEDGKK